MRFNSALFVSEKKLQIIGLQVFWMKAAVICHGNLHASINSKTFNLGDLSYKYWNLALDTIWKYMDLLYPTYTSKR